MSIREFVKGESADLEPPAPFGTEVPIDLGNKIEIEVIVEAEYHTIQIQFFRSRRGYFEKTTIFYKT
jgi:hypothetical protein